MPGRISGTPSTDGWLTERAYCQRMPLPACWPLADSAVMPPGCPWLTSAAAATDDDEMLVPLNENARSTSFSPELKTSDPPAAAVRGQYTGPLMMCPLATIF